MRARRYSPCSLLLVLLLPWATPAKATIEKQSFTSNNKNRTFYLFVPDSLNPAEHVPLLLVFHGSGRNGLSLVEKWKDLASKEKFIVAGLDSYDSSHWSTTADNPNVLRGLVELLESKYPVNPRRVYLFGHSAGAVFAIDLSMVESQYFAATAVHAGSWREKSEYEMMRSARRKVPLAIWVGTRDPFFSLDSVRATRDALVANGFVVDVTEIPGHDHWYYDLAPKINEAAWIFLKRYELAEEPHFEEYVEADEAANANKYLEEIRKLHPQLDHLVNEANVNEVAIASKDLSTDRATIIQLATEESSLLQRAITLARRAAESAEQAAQLKVGSRNREYLTVIGQYHRKFVDLLEAKRLDADLLINEPSVQVIQSKRNENQNKIRRLQEELDELQKRLDQFG